MQTLIFGLTYGGIYTLMALAIGMVHSTTRIMNFSHAMVIMWGSMCAYWMVVIWRLPYFVGFLLAIVINMLLNVTIYKLCVERLGDLQENRNWIISLFGMAWIIQNVARILFGAETYSFPYIFNGARFTLFGGNILYHEVIMFVVAIIIGVAYQTMCNKTRFGRAIRAVSFRPNTAQLMGINSKAIIMACFAMAGICAAVAGYFIAPIVLCSYNMTSSIGIKGYAAALIGGVGNTKGAIIGGFVLGLVECVIGLFVSAAIRDVFSFLIMILVIIFLPGGIVSAKIFSRGRSVTEKV